MSGDNFKIMKKEHKAQLGIIGKHIASVFDMRSKRSIEIQTEIEQHILKKPVLNLPDLISFEVREMLAKAFLMELKKHRKIYLEMVAELKRLFQVREYEIINLIATVGRSVIAQRLANTLTYTGVINYGALGSSATAPANSDTTLTTEVFRKVTASVDYSDEDAFIDFFYSKSDTNGTYEEFGTFIDGAAGADTGQLFTHALTGGWTKTATESMTVAVQYTVN